MKMIRRRPLPKKKREEISPRRRSRGPVILDMYMEEIDEATFSDAEERKDEEEAAKEDKNRKTKRFNVAITKKGDVRNRNLIAGVHRNRNNVNDDDDEETTSTTTASSLIYLPNDIPFGGAAMAAPPAEDDNLSSSENEVEVKNGFCAPSLRFVPRSRFYRHKNKNHDEMSYFYRSGMAFEEMEL